MSVHQHISTLEQTETAYVNKRNMNITMVCSSNIWLDMQAAHVYGDLQQMGHKASPGSEVNLLYLGISTREFEGVRGPNGSVREGAHSYQVMCTYKAPAITVVDWLSL